MSHATDWSSDKLPPEASLTQTATARTFDVFHNATGWHQRESESHVFAAQYPLEYAVGSGANGLTFLIRRGNFLFQAPLSYYSHAKKWDFSPGYEAADLGFSRSVPPECINCHAGRAAPLRNQPGAFADPPFQELAIGCENCHGPGGAHIQSNGRQMGSIVNPAKLSARLAENICMNCHQTGDARVLQPGKDFNDFRPGEWLFDTAVILKKPAEAHAQQDSDLLEHFSGMEASRCFRASSGKLSCLTCHDPHREPAESERVAHFRSKCLTCHSEQSCTVPLRARAAQMPPDNCVGCHMPKRSVRQVSHSALTDHRIPARNGELITPASRKEVDGLIIVNAPPNGSVELSKITLLRAYGQLSARDPSFQHRFENLLEELSRTRTQEPSIQLALGHQALLDNKPQDAIHHLQGAFGTETGDATVDLEIGQAFAKLGRSQEAIEYTKKAVALEPYNAVMRKTLILLYINSRAYGEAREQMEQYIDAFPDDSFMRSLLAKVKQ